MFFLSQCTIYSQTYSEDLHNDLRCRALQQQLTAFANNQNKYKTPQQYYIRIFVTILSYRVLYRGEKHPQKSTSVKDRNVRQSSNLTMLETDLDIFFFSFLFTYLQTSLQKFNLSMQSNSEIQLQMLKCYYYALNYVRTDKKDIFANHFTENIYKVLHVNK